MKVNIGKISVPYKENQNGLKSRGKKTTTTLDISGELFLTVESYYIPCTLSLKARTNILKKQTNKRTLNFRELFQEMYLHTLQILVSAQWLYLCFLVIKKISTLSLSAV